MIRAETNWDEALTFMSIMCTETFFIRITRTEMPAQGGIEQSLRFFGARFIDTRQKSMNEKHYITETLDFHIQLAKAGFNLMGLAFFHIYPENFIKTKISLFLFPRIDT